MAATPLTRVVRTLHGAALRQGGAGLSDGQLLDAFLAWRDEAAFAALVRRHGPMVLGVCQRVLGNAADAEDAFQAVFLVLVRKAASVKPREQVGNWLYGVAYRTALKARICAARRRKHERQVIEMPHPEVAAEERWLDLQPVLDQELQQLPEKYRLPLVLCDLEGRTRRDVARQLGIPDGTLSNRLTQARRALARRLENRGITLSSGALAALLAQHAAGALLPSALLASTLQTVTLVLTSGITAVSPLVAELTEGVLKAMLWNKLKPLVFAVVLATLAAGLGWALPDSAPGTLPSPHPNAPRILKQERASTAKQVPPGRIYFHQGGDLHSAEANGLQWQDHGKFQHQGYQMDSARISPDGKVLAFGNAVLKPTGNKAGIYPPDNLHLSELGKNAPAKLLVQMEGLEFRHWSWSPDGSQIALTTWDAKEMTRNWIVDVKTKTATEVKLPRYRLKDVGEIQMSIQAWAPDGTRFLAAGDGLYLVKTDGTEAKQMIKGLDSIYGGRCQFSPGGSQVLYVVAHRKAKGRSCHLYVADLKTGTTKALVEAENFHDLRARWSPDGKQIAYTATPAGLNGERGAETTLFVIHADGSNTRTVLTDKHGSEAVGLVLTDWR